MRRLLLAALLLVPSIANAQTEAFPNFQNGETSESLDTKYDTCNVDGWWSYNRSCCCTTNWCSSIPGTAVREENGGYRVHLQPGMHPRVTAPATAFFPSQNVSRSPDGRYHFCGATITDGYATARCLLVPPGGV